MKVYDHCNKCGTSDPALLYRSRKMPKCIDCQHYDNLSNKQTGGGVVFTWEQFLVWRRTPKNRVCVYCGNTGDDLYALDIPNVRTKKRYEVIGVDRLDNSKSYSLDNIVPCCGPCNAIRGGILTHVEMLKLAPILKSLWNQRRKKNLTRP